MKKLAPGVLILLLGVFSAGIATAIEWTTPETARVIAVNWVTAMENAMGSWGDSSQATVTEVDEFARKGLLLGYWCHIQPQGFVLVSTLRESSPVIAFSPTWDNDATCTSDMSAVLAYKAALPFRYLEEKLGPLDLTTDEQIRKLTEFDYDRPWHALTLEPGEFNADSFAQPDKSNYQEYQILMGSDWTQCYPYNAVCPVASGCVQYPCYHNHCPVGCVATAAGQIMNYWDWPPFTNVVPNQPHFYNWSLVPDILWSNSPADKIDMTATLCADIGLGCLMDYCVPDDDTGDCESSAYHTDMLYAYLTYFHYGGNIPTGKATFFL